MGNGGAMVLNKPSLGMFTENSSLNFSNNSANNYRAIYLTAANSQVVIFNTPIASLLITLQNLQYAFVNISCNVDEMFKRYVATT